MRWRITSRSRFVAVLSLLGVLAAGGVALAAPSASRHSGLPAARVLGDQSSSPQRVVVFLRDQHRDVPATPGLIGRRATMIRSDQSPLHASVAGSGGRVTDTYQTVNAFAATVSGTERAKLAANPAVAQVVPDAFVRMLDPNQTRTVAAARGVRAAAASGASGPRALAAEASQQICPSNPSKPLLEPEALSIIHATEAQQLATGKGVKVAFIADGLDINNPDFVRPDGSHVFVDYRDFTGDGPNGPSGGAEAFGDASSIAAQGTTLHDLSRYVNPAHPLPSGCNVVIKGVSPGASLVGMKVFSANGAFTSVILQGMDWAVAVDHVDVLNESFGGDNVPDTTQDATKEFNDLAAAAGVTVTTASGDQGTANTIGSPASDPTGSAIDAGATTQFQHFAQTTRGGYQLSPHGWVNENIAEFSSAGFTQFGRTLDLVAPGNESYETCTPNIAIYTECTNFAGQPSDIRYFGGTSESAPLTAGVAALVIQAYRDTHGGASPSPALVKQLIVSNANDLNIPSTEQGAGELDALAAVRAAESVNGGSGSGNGRLVSPGQLDFAVPGGTSTGSDVTVTNLGSSTETIKARLRTLDVPVSDHRGEVTLNPGTDPTFLDQLGVSQSYKEIQFTVPPNVDRLDGSIAWPGPTATVNMTLFDPAGRFTAFTYHPAGGGADFSHIDVRNPPAGIWTAAFFTPTSGGFTGAVHYDLATARFGTVGSVTPSSMTLAPHATGSLHVSVTAPSAAGDYSRDLELIGSGGKTTVVPVVVRSLVSLAGGNGSFTGTITGGNGNGFVGREDTFAFDVPRGAPAIHVQLTLPHDPNTLLLGYLVSPTGQALGQKASAQSATGTVMLQMFKQAPAPGRWQFVLITPNPVGGTTTAAVFTATISTSAPPVSATGVPDSPSTVIARGNVAQATVKITNNGNAPLDVFVDPRRAQRTFYGLLAITPATGVSLPLNTLAPPPEFVVPTQTDAVFAAAQGTAPITFDWGFNDPDLEARSVGNVAFGAFSSPEVTPGVWFMAPALIGPFTGPASGTVNTGMAVHARVFDTSVTSSTGDPQLADVQASPPPASPITLVPGASATIPVTFTATGASGTLVRGDLFIDDQEPALGADNELTTIPYEYRVG